jgi:imidazolonepropionase-like amidohydrolase
MVVVLVPGSAFAQRHIVFVDVSVIRLDRERVEPGQTVVVEGDRIVAVGSADDVPIPNGAEIVAGRGRFLLAGLVDSHVHVTTDMPWAPARPDFGDGLLYLAHGVTTVVSLRGTPAQLEWKRRIETGELLGPTLYTAGEFVNEPRVTTPAEVRRDIADQARAGYDLIKFHEIWTPTGGFATRRGLSREAYATVFQGARDVGLPVVGHAPVNLGIEALFAARGGALAHVGELNRLHFVLGLRVLILTGAAALTLLAVVVSWSVAALSRRLHGAPGIHSDRLSRARALFASALALMVALPAGGLMVGPGGLFYDSVTWRVATALVGLGVTFLASLAVASAVRGGRHRTLDRRSKLAFAIAGASSIALVLLVALGWLPFLWRSSEPAIGQLARRFRDAGVAVQSTLVVYEALSPDGTRRALNDPSFSRLAPEVQSVWRRMSEQRPGAGRGGVLVPPRLPEFFRRVAGIFHRNGVLLLAGTDAMGMPMVAPGSSLIRELHLLVLGGLTPSEAIRTATVNPARFMGKDEEIGTIGVGARADLVVLDDNPLESLSALDRPAGVMVRGRWLPREQLDRMLSELSGGQ